MQPSRPVYKIPPIPAFAQVPCSKMVGLAKALRADGIAATGQDFVYDVSKLREADAERPMHELLNKHSLSLPIPVRSLNKPTVQGFPRLKPLDLFSYMAEAGHLNKLLGGKSVASSHDLLAQFWANYKNIHPDFELFSPEHSDIPLSDCIPILCHIDGGRGYKKSEFMIFNWGPILGRGCGKKCSKDPLVRSFRKQANKFHMALLGHSFTTHFLYACMPALWHKHNEDAFQALLEGFAEDLRECFDEGISYRGRILRLVLLGLKGDLKMQARAGRLTRWYATSRKRPWDPKKPSKVTGKCCWLCDAGTLHAPMEEIHSMNPAWLRTMASNPEPPWDQNQEGGMLKPSLCYLQQPAKFYLGDLFHIYLAGVGQDFAASCLVYMLPVFFPGHEGNNVDKQLETLNKVLLLWRKMHKVPLNMVSFNRDRLTFPDAKKVYPTGTWSKASDTTRIVQFILYCLNTMPHVCEREADKMLYYMKQACEGIEGFMQGLYKADLWIDSSLHACFLETLYGCIPLELVYAGC